MMYSCTLLGQMRPALWAADKVRSLVTRHVVAIPDRPKLTQTVEGYRAMRSHVLVRFRGHHREAEQVYRDDLGMNRTVQRCGPREVGDRPGKDRPADQHLVPCRTGVKPRSAVATDCHGV